ncbi:DUF6907 domain-containing protein [Amycolatopsis thermophila]|uniref:Uncharacterized protein n=1 Tax=Amycolatopsis thermophila TaxID=206084 RepID=A0ABU0F4D1_9PSEU|nr:hypothetical protein [Amycolatopsis thermophila]MDQ0382445.1 hypothetical protein [Amycolatopsis thermophila]
MSGRRPFWQTKPCPEWCDEEHCEATDPEERYHFHRGPVVSVVMTKLRAVPRQLGPRVSGWDPVVVDVSIDQHVDAAEPTITLGDGLYDMTPAEAYRLGMGLVEAARMGGFEPVEGE